MNMNNVYFMNIIIKSFVCHYSKDFYLQSEYNETTVLPSCQYENYILYHTVTSLEYQQIGIWIKTISWMQLMKGLGRQSWAQFQYICQFSQAMKMDDPHHIWYQRLLTGTYWFYWCFRTLELVNLLARLLL